MSLPLVRGVWYVCAMSGVGGMLSPGGGGGGLEHKQEAGEPALKWRVEGG